MTTTVRAPQAPAPARTPLSTRQRRPGWAALAVTLILGFAALGAFLYLRAGAKVAVMPRDLDDVLTLLTATRAASKKLRIPLISMSMGPLGAVTRMMGGVFGSSLSFAVGAAASAPGQVPIEDLNTALAILQKSMGGK